MTGYGVKIVADGTLPEDADWIYAMRADGTMVLIISRSAAGTERCLSEAWAAYRCMVQKGVIPSPVIQAVGA